jgi:transcriptional regulator with XRE-family HTH domain
VLSTTILRDRRRSLGLSLDELARRTAIERSKLCRVERCYARLRPDEAERLAAELQLVPEEVADFINDR